MASGSRESLAGFLVGAVFGSAAVLLLTPKTGNQIRNRLVRQARELMVRASRLGFDPNGWRDLVAKESSRNVVNNIERIRAAGL